MTIKPIQPENLENVNRFSQEEIKREREKLQREVENTDFKKLKNRYKNLDR